MASWCMPTFLFRKHLIVLCTSTYHPDMMARPLSPTLTFVSSNYASSSLPPPSPTLSTHSSIHFTTSLALRDNRPDERSGLSSLQLLSPPAIHTTRRWRHDSITTSETEGSNLVNKTDVNVDKVFGNLVQELRKYNNKPKDKAPTNTPTRGKVSRIWKGWIGCYNGESKKCRRSTGAAVRAQETTAELHDEFDREREIELIMRDLERMATGFGTEKSRLESNITELENENDRHTEELESLRQRVARSRREIETLRAEHKRRETELLDKKKEVEEQKARQLEEERNARELASLQYQERLSALQQQILRLEAEKALIKTEYDANVRAERERAFALDAELQRQAKVRVEEEQNRLLEEERQSACLQDAIARARQEVEKLIIEQERRKCEAAFGPASVSQGWAEAHALLLEKQGQALKHDKERCQSQIIEETERVRRTLEEAHAKKEQEAQGRMKAEEDRIRRLEEEHHLRLEEEQRRLSFLDEFTHEREKDDLASRDDLWRIHESERVRQARDAARAKLEEECRQMELREETFRKQLEEEVAQACRAAEHELVGNERRAEEVQYTARLSRALVHEAQEKARLAEENKHKRIPGEELVVLYRRVAEAEDYRRQLEYQQVLYCSLAALDKLHSLVCTLAEVKLRVTL